LLLEGTYNISASINIQKSNVTLEGQGAGTKLFLVNGANCNVILVSATTTTLTGIKVANLRIDGNKTNQTLTIYGVNFYGPTSTKKVVNSIVENCIIENCSGAGIYLFYADGNIISRNCLNSNADEGIYIHLSNNNIIIGNQVNLTSDKGIILWGSNDNIVIGNIAKSTVYYDGIFLQSSSYNTIIGNRCQGNHRYGINISESGCNNNLVVKNYLTGNTVGPLNNAGTGTIIEGNIGYSTEYIKSTGASVTIGTGDTYGPATAFTPLSGIIRGFDLNINIGGTFGADETVTVKIESVYSDATTGYIEKSFTTTGSLALSPTDKIALIKGGVYITKINVYAKTNLSSTTVTCSVDIAAAT
jgi:parallel beta-helix repeat protein